jgi:hypothetical protein
MKAVITKSQLDRIKNFINETKEISKEDVIKNPTDKQKEFQEYLANKRIYPAGPPMAMWMVAVALVLMVTLYVIL